ncbi:hypothetical protein NDU88_000947 [Pleurodeles waltl]|uniref:Uncharacterized protein n=1 Tax=Pleurodeles waltl TaxID=8319 RepID=A0AAV7SAY9_PLEWA|nr:hypothetical protein NDU88_000947 [Pleurodeles waltl]
MSPGSGAPTAEVEEGRRHREAEERKVRTESWKVTDQRDQRRSKTVVRRIATQKEGEDAQRLAMFREERGHLRYEPLRKWGTGRSRAVVRKRGKGGMEKRT